MFFEEIRSPALDWVFGILSLMGEAVLIAGAVLLLYWLLDGRTGEQLLLTATSSAAFNCMLKASVLRPRPYMAGVVSLHPDTPLFSSQGLGDNLSFPSGHAQATSSALFAGALRLRGAVWRTLGWALSAILTLLVCCSRLYFGVHYPSDLFAGVLLGLLFALFWQLIFAAAYRFRYYILLALAVAALCVLPFSPSTDFIRTAGMVVGCAIFLPLSTLLKYDAPKQLRRRFLRIPVGLFCTGAVFAGSCFFPEGHGFLLLQWLLLAGAATFLATLCFKVLKI